MKHIHHFFFSTDKCHGLAFQTHVCFPIHFEFLPFLFFSCVTQTNEREKTRSGDYYLHCSLSLDYESAHDISKYAIDCIESHWKRGHRSRCEWISVRLTMPPKVIVFDTILKFQTKQNKTALKKVRSPKFRMINSFECLSRLSKLSGTKSKHHPMQPYKVKSLKIRFGD